MSSPEENVVSAIKRSLKKIKNRHPIWMYRTHGDGRTLKGVPDLHFVFWGFAVWIEVKAPGKKPTPLQLKRIEEINQAGGFAGWVDSRDQFEDFIDSILNQLEGIGFCIKCRKVVSCECPQCGRNNLRVIPGNLFLMKGVRPPSETEENKDRWNMGTVLV